MLFTRLATLLWLLLVHTHAFSLFGLKKSEPELELHCFRGSKMGVMSDPRQESVLCESAFGLDQYCYKFVAYSPVHQMVKLGCASVMCSPFRNTCADFELGGAQGRLCCCNHGSYCNGSGNYKNIALSAFTVAIVSYIF